MGWGRMLLLGNWGQQMDIEDQRRELETLRRDLRRQHRAAEALEGSGRLAELERENAELRLYLAALVRYLAARGTVDPEEFAVLVEEVDREDGQQDGGFHGELV